MKLRVWGLSILALAGGGCYSGASADEKGNDDGGGGEHGTTGTDAATTAGGEETGEDSGGGSTAKVPAPTIRRLTTAEFQHSVRDLLGDVALSEVAADVPKEGFFAVGNATAALTVNGLELYGQALEQATGQAFSDPARAATVVSCVPQTTAEQTCYRDALADFGRRAWRRPLTSVELDRYLGVAAKIAEQTGDALAALRYAAWGLLESPNFLYRIEIGEPAPDDPARFRYTAYEMASRLSYTLWNTAPDAALLDAAERGELLTADGVRAQAERMLADPRARQGVENFISELYGVWRLDDLGKDDAVWTPSLRAAIRDDLYARIHEVVFDAPGDFFGLFDSTRVYVNNELAQLYGLPTAEPDAFRAAELPADGVRRGLIGSAAVLTMNSPPARTSPTKRGHFIADALLCRSVPPPPPGIELNLDEGEGEGPKTMREKLEVHRVNPSCASCHAITDPMGLALENFDTLGRFRADDRGLPIDANGDLDGALFSNAAELAGLLRDHPEAPGCLVRKLYTYATGRLPVYAEFELLRLLEDDLSREDNRFDQLLLALVTRDDFRFVNPEGTVVASVEGEMP